MSLATLLANNTAPKSVILKVDTDPEKSHEHEKRKGFQVVSGWLENGDETFIVLTPEEFANIPEKNGYINLSGIAVIKTNKIGKKYIQRINPLEKLTSVDFKNPF